MACKNTESCKDFLLYLGTDMSLYIMSFLHDPADLVCASSISRLWYQFVVENGFAKELCFKTVSGCSNFTVTKNETKGKSVLEIEHEVYATLLYIVQKSDIFVSCGRTKDPQRFRFREPDNWLSNGRRNAQEQATLTLNIMPGIWAITEIHLRPCPKGGSSGVFSAKALRIKIGHSKFQRRDIWKPIDDEEVEWKYTSPEFPMKPEYEVQPFKLPQPVISWGVEYLKIEFLGMVQRDQEDGFFYICLDYTKVYGHQLFPAFDLKCYEPYPKPLLEYDPNELGDIFRTDHSCNQVIRPRPRVPSFS